MSDILKKVEKYNVEMGYNCAITSLKILSEEFSTSISDQIIFGAIGMNGAGQFGAQCGLVEGGLMFLGIHLAESGFKAPDIALTCNRFASEFITHFSSLTCSDLRPEGFKSTNPPHMCSDLIVQALEFDIKFIKNLGD